MSTTVSIKVKKEIAELAEKMVKYGLARSKSHAFNILIERGLKEVLKEVEFWDEVYKEVEELRKRKPTLRMGFLSKLLEEGRER